MPSSTSEEQNLRMYAIRQTDGTGIALLYADKGNNVEAKTNIM